MTQVAANPNATMARLVDGYKVSQAISVAARLKLADHADSTPRSAEHFAAAAGTHVRSTYRLLRALASVGVFEETDDHLFRANALSDLLRSDRSSIAGWSAFTGGAFHWRYWLDLEHAIRTGEDAPHHLDGESVWDVRAKDPEANAIFNAAMSSLSGLSLPALVAAGEWSRFPTLVDVGGGDGTLLMAILRAHAGLRGTVFDLPHVVEAARARIAAAGLGDRMDVAPGSFFSDRVPPGAAAYVMKSVLHDFDDDSARAVLLNVRESVPSDGRLVLIEGIIRSPGADQLTAFSDLNMLVNTGGSERTEEEWHALMDSAGFRIVAISPTANPRFSIIEAVRGS